MYVQMCLSIFVIYDFADMREQVPWEEVEFQSNQPCVDLIEKKPTGLLFMIEEECILPHGSDAQLLQKMHTRHSRSSAHYVKPKLDPATFGIRHFAGEVVSFTSIRKGKSLISTICTK
jgi:myosin heavy subunit